MQLSIKHRLMSFSVMAIVFVLTVGAVGLVAAQRESAVSSQMAENTTALRLQMQADMMHDAVRGDALRAVLAGTQQETTEFKAIRAEFDEHAASFRESIQGQLALSLPPEHLKSVEAVKPRLEAYLGAAQKVLDTALSQPDQVASLLPAFQSAYAELEDPMEALGEGLETRAQHLSEESMAAARQAWWLIGLASLASVVALVLFSRALRQGILVPIAEATRVARTVAAGDLTSRIDVKRQDEIGELLNALRDMNEHLRTLVGDVRQAGEAIATGADEIALGNSDLSHRTETQASNLQQTAASMEQLTSSVNHNAEAALQANQLASQARDVASRGGELVSHVVGTMGEISEASRKINDIIGVIDGIAFQTNILALNAAVEAARAGEQGRGFAVVAGEVRSLARRSADAAREIKQLIHNSVEKVDNGSRLVSDAGHTMEEIVTQVRRVSELIEEISHSTHEQSTGISQVSQAVGQLDEVTQQNAALVEQSAAAAESLKGQSHRLVSSVHAFRLGEG
ncbi:methyl-accepting chemotaxis protein [Aquabacterium lacunae]|nr:methyl-accepting chemotaxis protein [Aquabacterium lacunae]